MVSKVTSPIEAETESRQGIIFDIRKYSVHDGPGIRTTVFFKGCPLRCVWCHNPEGLEPVVEIAFRSERCICCRSCLTACRQSALSWGDDGPVTDRDLCARCGSCTDVCFSEARESVGKEMTVEQVMTILESDHAFYDESGGGVTLSGGEPLMQSGFARALLESCKRKGIHTSIDTCGFAPWEELKKISEYTDLILYDLKLIDDEQHREYTGVSNDIILTNLRNVSVLGHTIIIRMPIIPGINDDDENIYRVGSFAASLPQAHDIELLPYHNLGIHKYQRFSKHYSASDIRSPSRERMLEIKNLLTGLGLTVTLRNEQYDQ
jgi:pyruvate formate lyase activating enzyme